MSTISAVTIPVQPRPQRFSIVLLGVTYNMRTRWSVAQNCWSLDIADQDNNPLVSSIAIVTGADLLEQYRYLGFGGGLYVDNTVGSQDTVPTFSDFGITAQLIFVPDTALIA